MTPLRTRCLLAISLLGVAGLALAAKSAEPTITYVEAKALADKDEATLENAANNALVSSQRAMLEDATKACRIKNPKPDLGAFVIVMRIDSGGHVDATWRKGDTPLARCMEAFVRDKALLFPPRAPFYSSLEISFADK